MKLDCEENILRKIIGLYSWKNVLSYLGSLIFVGKYLVIEVFEVMVKLLFLWNEEDRIIFSWLWLSYLSIKSNGLDIVFINDFKKY